jgi:uncharacterized membrane protein
MKASRDRLAVWQRIACMAMLALVLTAWPRIAGAQSAEALPADEILEATVGHIAEEREIEVAGQTQLYQKMELIVTSGPRQGEVIVVEHGGEPQVTVRRYRVGERVFVRASVMDGVAVYHLDTPSRWVALTGAFILFVALVIGISRWRGGASLLGLGISFAVLFLYILPRLGAGQEPLRVILIGGALIVPPTFYLSHGVSLKTTVAVVGTALALALTVLLAWIMIQWVGLTGYASEEASFLQMAAPGLYRIRDLLMAGIVIGVLGVLDDVTVSQAAIVQQLREANAQLGFAELYRRAMQVGQDHIASMVNTLALVYAGAALPLLLLLRESPLPLTYLLSQEIIAEEVVRMLVASIGLMAAVPLTTLLAAGATGHLARKGEA